MDTFENVMQLAIEGCKAVATYIREVRLYTHTHTVEIFNSCLHSIKLFRSHRYYWKTPSSWSLAEVYRDHASHSGRNLDEHKSVALHHDRIVTIFFEH